MNCRFHELKISEIYCAILYTSFKERVSKGHIKYSSYCEKMIENQMPIIAFRYNKLSKHKNNKYFLKKNSIAKDHSKASTCQLKQISFNENLRINLESLITKLISHPILNYA